jgi:hypothetical protein
MMKKNSFIAIVLAVVLGFILSACGKDDVVHIGPTNIVYSIVGGWSKWQSGNTLIGCRFDSNGDAYFATWATSTSPTWENPCKWSVSGSVLTVKTQEEKEEDEEVIFTCNFLVYNEGKSLIITNVQTADQWQFLSNLEGELDRMKINKDSQEEE